MNRHAWLTGIGCCIAMAFAPPLHAQQQILIYRCTDAAGKVTVQNDKACPKGSREQREVIETPPPLPAFQPPETPDLYIPPVKIVQRPGQATPEPQPPPGLYQCTTWDQLHYFTEAAEPQRHCAPLQVIGIDGVSRPQASACEMVKDQCTQVPAESLCQAW